jgi:tellurite methyltransferase
MNSEEQRARWDLKYERGLTSLTQPDPFFISVYWQFVDQFFPNAGVALDLAGGLGRHALWLSSRNWRVTVVDLSDVAIGKLSKAALKLKVNLDPLVGDAAEYKFEPTRFDRLT